MDGKKKNRLNHQTFFFAVILFAVLTILLMFVDGLMDMIGIGVFAFWILLTISGVLLVVFTLREKIEGKQKIFLLMTGFAAAGFFLFVVLHNGFYALSTLTDHMRVLDGFLDVLGGTFFITATILCPIGIIVGAIGTLLSQTKQ